MTCLPYHPDQPWLLPPSVRDVLGDDHLCFFVHEVVERLDLSAFTREYGEEGQRPYDPALMVKVWLYAYALGITSTRRLEQRIREDLALRFLAANATPDHWTLNHFRTRHAAALQEVFVRVVEVARGLGMAKLGHVAVDSTRVRANASHRRVDRADELRERLARTRREIERWQRQLDAADPDEAPGTQVNPGYAERLEEQLRRTQQQLQELENRGVRQQSRTDPDSRFLRTAGGYVLGYTTHLAVSDDHLIVAQGATQAVGDEASLLPVVDQVKATCGEWPSEISADSGFFSVKNLDGLQSRRIEGYLPDAHLCGELRGTRGPLRCAGDSSEHRRMRARLRSPWGQALVEPVIGVLKEQRGLRRFRLRGLGKVRVEWALACTAFNLTRMWRLRAQR